MAGQKRTRSGDPKPQSEPQPQQPQGIPCGQAQHTASTTPSTVSASEPVKQNEAGQRRHHANKNASTGGPKNQGVQKRPLLPSNAVLSKRPLLHPALPTPFASSASPKVLYVTATSPFVPACKRIRALLSQIAKRSAQSGGDGGRGKRRQGLEANGRLEARDVEASIAAAAASAAIGRGKGKGREWSVRGEEVYVKATGRAIPRALELGVKFQAEDDCRVRVEMGNVKAIDDVGIAAGVDGEGDGAGEDEVPETRIRTLSTVTVCIGLA